MFYRNESKAALVVVASIAIPSFSISTAFSQEEDDYERILVTANRTVSEAAKTPIALTVIGPEQLRNQGISDASNLGDIAPNLSLVRNGSALQITIRGVSSTDTTEKGDPSAAFMLDNVYIARSQAQDVSFFDIDRIEILRGPQGTLYGRNTTAGLINVIAVAPIDDFEAGFDLALGSYNSKQFSGVVNLPVNDELAIRAAVNIDQRDNYLTTTGNTAADISDFKDNTAMRISALYTGLDNINILVRADYSQMQGNNFAHTLLSNIYSTPFSAPEEGVLGSTPNYLNTSTDNIMSIDAVNMVQPARDDSTWGLGVDVKWSLSNDYSVNYIGVVRGFDRQSTIAYFIYSGATPTESNWFEGDFVGSYEQISHEFRLAYQHDNLQAQAGVYYFKEESDIQLDLLGLFTPNEGEDGYVYGFPQKPTIAESFAVFAQAAYSLTNKLRFTAGVRATNDDKSRTGAVIIHEEQGMPVDFASGDTLNNAARSDNETTFKLGIDYDLAAQTLVYGVLATGYKAGGFNDGCLEIDEHCSIPITEEVLYYQPETLTSTELGIKSRLLNYKLTINANIFHYDYKDLQLTQTKFVNGGPQTFTTNAAVAKIKGVEVESVYRIDETQRVNVAINWLDAKYDDWEIVPGANFSGLPLSRSPKWSITAGYKYTMDLASGAGIDFAITSQWSDKYFLTNNQVRANFVQPSYTRTNVTVTYNHGSGDWYTQLYLKNIENNVAVTNVNVNGDLQNGVATLSDPRLVGIRFGYRL